MKILFATGGTAGHINPALAVASYIREKYPDSEILFVGTADHMESRLVPNAGFDFKTIKISGFRRSFAPKVMLTVEDAKKHLEPKNEVVVTGLPVRGELLKARKDISRKELGIPNGKYLVLSFGGSLGAKPLNDAMFDILLESANNDKYYHIHSVGTNGGEFLEKFKENGFVDGKKGLVKGNVEVRQYIDDMDTCMSGADLVIGRAGASSLSEIEALGKASILIPSPYVAENHQFHNAMALVNRGAGSIIEEKDLTTASLKEAIDSMLSNPAKLIQIEENAKNMAITDARERIADIIISLAK